MYGLRKFSKDGKNPYNDFMWSLKVGAEAEAPDWNPDHFCGGGLHCLPNAKGNWGLLWGAYWAVVEFDEKDMVQIDTGKCKVRKCKIVFLSEKPEGMLKFFDHEKFDSKTAFEWAYYIGNKDVMIDIITEWCYYFDLYLNIHNITKDGDDEEKYWLFKASNQFAEREWKKRQASWADRPISTEYTISQVSYESIFVPNPQEL